MWVKYEGPLDEVVIPTAGDVLAVRGRKVEVPTEIGRTLIEQEHWSRAPVPRARDTKPATPEPAAASSEKEGDGA